MTATPRSECLGRPARPVIRVGLIIRNLRATGIESLIENINDAYTSSSGTRSWDRLLARIAPPQRRQR